MWETAVSKSAFFRNLRKNTIKVGLFVRNILYTIKRFQIQNGVELNVEKF